MKIGMVCVAADPIELGSAESAVPALSTALTDAGHEVVLLTRRRSSQLEPWLTRSRFAVRALTAGPPSALPEAAAFEYVGDFVRALSRELETGGFDVLHSHGWLAGLATHLAAHPHRAPHVHTFTRVPLTAAGHDGAGAPDRLQVERLVALRTGRLIATSVWEQQMLMRIGVTRARIAVVPPAVATPGTEIETAPGEPVGRRLIAFGPPARAAELIRALVALPDVELVICGTPESPLTDAGGQLAELAAGLGVAGRLRLERAETPARRSELIRGAHIAICLASSVRPGVDHLEAMAHGVPVLAGNPQAREVVIDGVTGLHMVDTTPRALITQIRKLLNNPTMHQQMGAVGLDRAATRYSWTRIAAETLAVYEREVVDTRARRPVPNPTGATVS